MFSANKHIVIKIVKSPHWIYPQNYVNIDKSAVCHVSKSGTDELRTYTYYKTVLNKTNFRMEQYVIGDYHINSSSWTFFCCKSYDERLKVWLILQSVYGGLRFRIVT